MDQFDYVYMGVEKFNDFRKQFKELWEHEPVKLNSYIANGEFGLDHFILKLLSSNYKYVVAFELDLRYSHKQKKLIITDEEHGYEAKVYDTKVIVEPYHAHKGSMVSSIEIGYESAVKKKLIYDAMAAQNRNVQDWIDDIASVFYAFNLVITHLPDKIKQKTEKDTRTVAIKKGNKKTYKSVVYLKHTYIVDDDFALTKSEIKHIIKCPAWGVRGHYRHYKSGMVIFIKPYVKGKDRHEKQKYISKDYKV